MVRPALGALVLALFLAMPAAAPAQEGEATTPPPFRDFTFKRVKPPSPGSGPRIRVQIAPRGDAAPVALPPATLGSQAVQPPAESRAVSAFWTALSQSGADPGPGRLFDALDVLEAQDGVSGGLTGLRLQDLQSIVNAHGRDILVASAGTEVSPALVLAMIAVESSGDATAVSSAGAQGLMQLMPATAARFGVTDPFDALDNVRGGFAVLAHLMGTYEEDPLLVLAAYNAGEGAVREHGGVPPYAETRGYVPKVLTAYRLARGLCLTPPLLLSDGCVFVQAEG